MSGRQAATRRGQRLEALCAASIRALGGDPELHFRGGGLHRGRTPVRIHAPHLHPSPEEDDVRSLRGAADGIALRVRYSDDRLHREMWPADPLARLVFELLEQYRVESLVPPSLPGARANLRYRHERYLLGQHHDGLTETQRGLLVYTVAEIGRSRLTGEPVIAETEDLIEATRAALAPLLGDDLARLRPNREDQSAYAGPAGAIAEAVAALYGDEDAAEDTAEREPDADRARPTLLVDFDEDAAGADETPAAALGRSPALTGEAGGYRVFTTAHDQEHRVAALVRPAVLAANRERLDLRIARQGVNNGRLARDLRTLLATPVREGWDGGQEEGRVDGRALARLVTSPAERRLFRIEREDPIADVLVTFLIDCSGSMKQHAEPIAVLVDVFARALEQAGGRSEILGFTTGAWNGGRVHRDWQRAGRPPRPGRLNERCHLIFKDADTPWRRARTGVAGLLKPDLFREGVDGEAVTWAAGRARAHGERRSLLVVISDGSPMDAATHRANDPHYLEQHLADVVAAEERAGREIYGVGVGLDLSAYYGRSRVLDTSATGYAMFADVLDLIGGARRGSRAA